MAIVLLPIMFVAMMAGVFASFIQVGAMFTTEPLKFKLSKIDPVKGFKRIFSVRALVELAKSLLKISFAGVVVFIILWLNMPEVMRLSQKSVETGFHIIAQLTA